VTDEDKTNLSQSGKAIPAGSVDPNTAATRLRPRLSPEPGSFLNDETQVTISASESKSAHLSVGYELKGRFRLLEVLGEGGMGVVFKAIDLVRLGTKSHNPYVAIKVLNLALANNDVLIAGLQREWEKTHELSHPNIVRVYDFDREGDFVFMSMEYLMGRPLTQIIRETANSGGLKLEQAWPIIRGMGNALAYAHKNNIVHSDFKPGNVFVTDSGDVKVLDFGIASRLGQTDFDETIFDARAEGGLTPPYASFEMINGSRADPRDDIYAFGLVVYELLSGKHPYNRKPASAVFLEQRKGHKLTPPPISGLNRKQWQLLKSALEILQEERPAKLDEWLNHFDPKISSKWLYPFVGGVALVLLGVASFIIFQPDRKPTRLPTIEKTGSLESPASKTEVSPPLANAGNTTHGMVGEPILLNGGLSRSLDGSPLTYSWRLIDKPDGSNSILLKSSTVSPEFIPDKAGDYRAELVVTDGNNSRSIPVLMVINVEQPAKPQVEILHEATSKDGALFLAASKPEFHIGEELKLSFRLSKSGYLRIAYVSSMGEVNNLLPNKYQSSKVKSDLTYQMPPKAKSFKLQISGPVGIDKIVAVFSENPLPKAKNIANPDGSIANEFQNLTDSTAVIQYGVLKK
jgi:serine/threonine protein kinase